MRRMAREKSRVVDEANQLRREEQVGGYCLQCLLLLTTPFAFTLCVIHGELHLCSIASIA